LAIGSIAAFGKAAWTAFPAELVAQASHVLLAGSESDPGPIWWGSIQTVYGLIRYIKGGAALAWLAQGGTTFVAAIIVWLVWRSSLRFTLKAAALSAAALIATPYAFVHDMAAVAIPVAFLAKDQIRCGLLRGEQTILIGLFAALLAVFVGLGDPPVGLIVGHMPVSPIVIIMLLGLILRRALILACSHPPAIELRRSPPA
jgi:hypothetical protein